MLKLHPARYPPIPLDVETWQPYNCSARQFWP